MSRNTILKDKAGNQVLPITTSENVFTGEGTTLKETLDNMAQSGTGGAVVIDGELSTESTNPVENKIVTGAINDINDELTTINEALISSKKGYLSDYDYETGSSQVVAQSIPFSVKSFLSATYDLVVDCVNALNIIRQSVPTLKVPTNAINEGDDLNAYTSVGEYYCVSSAIAKSLSNCPYTNTGFKLRVETLSYSKHYKQTLEGVYGNGTWYRTSGTDTVSWGAWKKTANAGESGEYEEGSWTPTVPSGYSYTIARYEGCKYKKVGNIVFVQGAIILSGTSAIVGLSGLPFNTEMTGTYAYFGTHQILPIKASINVGANLNATPTKIVDAYKTYGSNPAQMIFGAEISGNTAVIIQGYYTITS